MFCRNKRNHTSQVKKWPKFRLNFVGVQLHSWLSPWGVRNLLKIYPRLHYFWLKYVKSLFGCWKRGYLNWFFDGNNAYQILILLVWIPTSIYEKKMDTNLHLLPTVVLILVGINAFLALFWAYVKQPDNHIGWATLMSFLCINLFY